MEFNEFFVRGMALLGAGIAMIAGVGQGIGQGIAAGKAAIPMPQARCAACWCWASRWRRRPASTRWSSPSC